MTEENKTPAVTPPAAETPPATETPAKVHPPGYEPVDFDALGLTPEQKATVETRTRYLYHQVRAGKEERESLRKHNDDLQRAIDERLATLEKAKVADQEVQITQAIKTARDEGRVEDELKLTRQLNSLEAPKPKAEPKTEEKDWWKEPAEKWAVEVDQENKLIRPWIIPAHPDNARATGTLFKIKERWEQEGRELNKSTLPFLLTELDMHMKGTNGATPPQTVLSTSQVRAPAPKDTELTAEEKYFADRTMAHVADSKERYRRYAAQRALTRKK